MASITSVMHKDIVGVASSAQLKTALSLMKLHRVSLVPVLEGSKLVGILTREKAEKKLSELGDNAKVNEAMEAPFAYATEDSSIEEAAKLLIANHITRLPIVNNRKEMVCIGIVTSTDIVNASS